MVEDGKGSSNDVRNSLAFSAFFWLISCVVYASTMSMEANDPLKCRTLAVTHGVKIQKTDSFTVVALRTSSPARKKIGHKLKKIFFRKLGHTVSIVISSEL
jgi:hypothetical protein